MNDQYNEPTSYLNSGIKVTETAIQHLTTARKWAMFLAIIGFISVGFFALAGIFAVAILSSLPMYSAMPVPPALFSVIYFIFAVIHFFPAFYLLKFSTTTKRALEQRDELILENALEALKSLYKYIGVFVAVLLALYVLILLIITLIAVLN